MCLVRLLTQGGSLWGENVALLIQNFAGRVPGLSLCGGLLTRLLSGGGWQRDTLNTSEKFFHLEAVCSWQLGCQLGISDLAEWLFWWRKKDNVSWFLLWPVRLLSMQLSNGRGGNGPE